MPVLKTFFGYFMFFILGAILLLILAIAIFVRTTPFGVLSKGDYLQRILQSQNFRDGQFQNLSPTPSLTEGASYLSVTKEIMFHRSKRRKPGSVLPSIKTDLHALNPNDNVLVWFGHSSYFLQVDGKKMLIDPVFSGAASPVSATTRSFAGSDIYTPADIPELDILFLSHDHWDHLDFSTVKGLQPKIKKIITSLGTGAHLRRWGFAPDKIIEKDWNETVSLGDGFTVTITPGRHFSGRGLKRNQALWVSFVLQTPSMNLFLGGDSGYDKHFKEIGAQFGPFDLAILECGQYDKSWRYIHMIPEETVQAAQDLKAAKLLPVHWAKFSLGNHEWDDSILRVTAAARKQGMPLIHPMIGELVHLHGSQTFTNWWENV